MRAWGFGQAAAVTVAAGLEPENAGKAVLEREQTLYGLLGCEPADGRVLLRKGRKRQVAVFRGTLSGWLTVQQQDPTHRHPHHRCSNCRQHGGLHSNTAIMSQAAPAEVMISCRVMAGM